MTRANRATNADGTGSRRAQVANACMTCRVRKVKCCGKHPTCSRCRIRGISCEYDVSEEGITKRQHLRQELFEQKQELDRATAVLDVLQNGSDQDATATLARLRLGQTLENEVDLIEIRRQSLQAQQDASSTPIAHESLSSPFPLPPAMLVEHLSEDMSFANSPLIHHMPSEARAWSRHPPPRYEQIVALQSKMWEQQSNVDAEDPMAWSQPVSQSDHRLPAGLREA